MAHTEAQTLYGTARELIAAASVLHQCDSSRFVPSINLLMGFASEMLLKSALAQDGVAAEERHGHDLKNLHSKAEGRGLLEFPQKENFSEIVKIMAEAHKRNSLRYLKQGSEVSVVTSTGPAISALNDLDTHIRKVVVAD